MDAVSILVVVVVVVVADAASFLVLESRLLLFSHSRVRYEVCVRFRCESCECVCFVFSKTKE